MQEATSKFEPDGCREQVQFTSLTVVYVHLFFLFCRRRERHAKTIDIAQEEVLTCLGIHLYERLHRIWQKLRAEEQTWQLLFHTGIDALRKSFEVPRF